jgi:hypothetical protein
MVRGLKKFGIPHETDWRMRKMLGMLGANMRV